MNPLMRRPSSLLLILTVRTKTGLNTRINMTFFFASLSVEKKLLMNRLTLFETGSLKSMMMGQRRQTRT